MFIWALGFTRETSTIKLILLEWDSLDFLTQSCLYSLAMKGVHTGETETVDAQSLKPSTSAVPV